MGTFSKKNLGEKSVIANKPHAHQQTTTETIVLDDSDSDSSLVIDSNNELGTSEGRESADDVKFLNVQNSHDDDPTECFIVEDDANKTIIKILDITLDKVPQDSNGELPERKSHTPDIICTPRKLKLPKKRSRTHYINPLQQMSYGQRLQPMSRRTVLQLMRTQNRRMQNAQLETIAEQSDVELRTRTPVGDSTNCARGWYPQKSLPAETGTDAIDVKPIDEPYIPVMTALRNEIIDVSVPEIYIPSKKTTLPDPDAISNDSSMDIDKAPFISVENDSGLTEDYLIIDDVNCLTSELADNIIKKNITASKNSIEKVEPSNVSLITSEEDLKLVTNKPVSIPKRASQPFRRANPIHGPTIHRRPRPLRRRFFDARLQVIILAGDCVQRFEAHEIRRRIVERLGGWFEGPRFNDSALRYEQWLQVSCADSDSAEWLVRQDLGFVNGRPLQIMPLSDAPYRPIASMFFKKTHHNLPRIMELIKMQNFHTGLRIDMWKVCRHIKVRQGMQLILNIHVEDIPILMKMDFCVYFELHLLPIRLWNRDRPWGRAPFIE